MRTVHIWFSRRFVSEVGNVCLWNPMNGVKHIDVPKNNSEQGDEMKVDRWESCLSTDSWANASFVNRVTL